MVHTCEYSDAVMHDCSGESGMVPSIADRFAIVFSFPLVLVCDCDCACAGPLESGTTITALFRRVADRRIGKARCATG